MIRTARGLRGAALCSCRVEPFAKATFREKVLALAFKLPMEQIRRLIDRAQHRVGSELGLCLRHEFGQSEETSQADSAARRWQTSRTILRQSCSHRPRFVGIFWPYSQASLYQKTLIIPKQLIGQARAGDIR
jgi:hypothetical protein